MKIESENEIESRLIFGLLCFARASFICYLADELIA